jgi:CubicO group peptidase (beta-lactamase class C family)
MTYQPDPTHQRPRREQCRLPDPHSAPDGGSVSDRGPAWELTRREFVTGIAKTTLVGAIAPFSFVRTAPPRTDELERYLRRKLVEANTPGIAVAVVREGEIVWSAGVGWADRERRIRVTSETVFQLASVSKTLTCAGIMALVEDGVIDLDADVNTYLPFEVHVPHAPSVPITMRDLLTHTSAIRDRWQVWGTPWSQPTLYFHGDSPISLGDFCRSYFVHGGTRYRRRRNFYERAPGIGYAYSNLAVALAGFVAEAASGVDFDELCKQRVFAPLGMTDTGFRLADIETSNLAMPFATVSNGELKPIFHYGYPDYPDGALRTSAVHLARWLGAFMNFGAFDGARVLDESTVREIRRQQIPDLVGWRQGLIWYGQTRWGFFTMGHTGGDYGESTRMFFRPDRRVGIISLTNAYLGDGRWAAFSDIERRLFQEFS